LTAVEPSGNRTATKKQETRISSSTSSTESGTGSLTITQEHPKPQLLAHAEGFRNDARQAYEESIKLKLARAKALLEGNRMKALEVYFEIQDLEKQFKKMDRKAKKYYFRAHNPANKLGEVDVHGLRVEEAISETERAVREVHRNGLRKLKVITGWGKHSKEQGVSALRSRILERLSVEHQLDATIQQGNPGALIISW